MATLTFRFSDRYSLGYAVLGRMVEGGYALGRTNLSVEPLSTTYDPLALTIAARLNGHGLPEQVFCHIEGVEEITLHDDKMDKRTIFRQAAPQAKAAVVAITAERRPGQEAAA